MLCLMCGQDNPDELTICPNCKAPMPKPSGTITSAPPQKVYERYNVLKETAEHVKDGSISVEQFAEYLNKTKEILSTKEQEVKDIEIPAEFYQDFEEEMNLGFSGIAMYKEGIDLMLTYVLSRDPSILDKGLEIIYKGNEAINDARMVNRENRRQMEELYMDATSFM